MMARILLVTNEYPPEKTAGTAMSTQFLAEQLAAMDHHVTVMVNSRRSAPAHERLRGVDVIRIRPLGLPLTRMAQRSVALTRLARRLKPDVIQGQSLSCGALAVRAGRSLDIPSVVYIQGLDLYESGRLARRTYIRWALSHSDAVVAVTEDLRERARALSGRSAEVIPHGLPWREAHGMERPAARRALGLPLDGEIVLFVGRLIPIKGVQFLLAAMPRLVATRPRLRLVVVGEGPHRPVLEHAAERLGLGPAITFAGGRSHEEVIRFMRAADIFVLPSLVESFGIVLVEAMSCGLPIVASRVMGIPSLVEDGRNGFLVAPADADALAGRIGELVDDAGLRGRLGAVNVTTAAGFAVSIVAERFLHLWGQVMDGRRRQD